MAVKSKTALNTDIDTEITTNGNNEITGADLNTILGNMVDSYEDFVGSYTTAQIAALVGMTLRQRVFDTDFNEYKYYDGTRWVFESHPKYEVYKALLTQSSTNAPVDIVLENTLGGTVVWNYEGIGQYRATLTGAFTANKTFLIGGVHGDGDPSTGTIGLKWLSANQIELNTSTGTDNALVEYPIRIEVYY